MAGCPFWCPAPTGRARGLQRAPPGGRRPTPLPPTRLYQHVKVQGTPSLQIRCVRFGRHHLVARSSAMEIDRWTLAAVGDLLRRGRQHGIGVTFMPTGDDWWDLSWSTGRHPHDGDAVGRYAAETTARSRYTAV